jgi:hypothetical protein
VMLFKPIFKQAWSKLKKKKSEPSQKTS